VGFVQVESPFPFLERRFGEVGLLGNIEDLVQQENPTPELAECAYHLGYFEEASAVADAVAASSNEMARMTALSAKVYARVALGDAEGAEQALREARIACRVGLEEDEGTPMHMTSIMCIRLLDDLISIYLQESPKYQGVLEDMPSGLRAFYGFQMAWRTLCRGEDMQAIGMVKGFLAVAGRRYPISCVKLHLVAASAHLRNRNPEQAMAEFDEAWRIAEPLGIVAPFVEMSAYLPGMLRRRLRGRDDAMYREMRSMVSRYREGWHGLRRLCKAPVPGENLTVLEYSTCMLAAWGWTNREIAWFLDISENTAKHYLSGSYQKLHVKNRSELTKICGSGALKENSTA